MYQRARAERSEVQNLIYGDSGKTNKNYMKQNYEELKQIQRETQQKIQEKGQTKENKFVMKKFRDVQPKLDRTGMLKEDANKVTNSANLKEHARSRTQDKNNQRNAPLNERNINNKPEPARKRSALQSAGKDMINSKPPKAQVHTRNPKPPVATSYKVGAHNPPPPEMPNVVFYTPESKEDIYALAPQVDPVAAHREKYIPRNIPVPRQTKPARADNFQEEAKAPKKEGLPAEKGYIAPKKEKNFVKANYQEAVDEGQMKVKARATNKQEQAPAQNKNYGKVPSYLKKYNKEREVKEARKLQMEADKDVPPGCKRMEESERLATLRDLEENKREVNNMLEKLPISMRTQALSKRKTELEDKLADIDRAISMFSKKVVYIAI
jgi:hypothetical protein